MTPRLLHVTLVLLLLHIIGILNDESEESEMMMEMLDEDLEGPAPDIWAWKLIKNRYLPHVRRRNRLYLSKDDPEESVVRLR